MAYCHVYPFISFVNEVIEANDANIYLSYCKINKVVTATDIEVYKYISFLREGSSRLFVPGLSTIP